VSSSKLAAQGQDILVEYGMRSITASGGDSGGACRIRREGDYYIKTGCFDVERTIVTKSKTTVNGKTTSSEEEGKEDFTRFDYVDVKGARGAAWYESGRVEVTRNGWKGEVIFEGGNEAPRWIMRQGDRTESGIVQDAAEPAAMELFLSLF
jgi:hypothetical protein